jgi:hypothetical protein
VSGLALNFESDGQGGRNPQALAEAFASIPDDVSTEAEAVGTTSSPGSPISPGPDLSLRPWELVDVDWVVPFAGMLLKLPYEQAAKYTSDDCWLLTDDQLGIINPAMKGAVQWIVWKLGAAEMVSHPLVAFGVALGSLTAVKYGVYQFHEATRREGGPKPSSDQQPSTTMDTKKTNGKMAESAGVSSSAASPAAAKAGYSQKGFVVVEE